MCVIHALQENFELKTNVLIASLEPLRVLPTVCGVPPVQQDFLTMKQEKAFVFLAFRVNINPSTLQSRVWTVQ